MSEHVSSVRLYVGIWLALLLCTGLTVFASFQDLGPFNAVVALAIATFKASLVVLFFMHVKYASEKMTKLTILTAIFFFLILITLSLADYLTRLWT